MPRLSAAGLALPLIVGWCAAQDAPPTPDPIAASRWALTEVLEAHQSATPACPRVTLEAFLSGTEPLASCELHRFQ